MLGQVFSFSIVWYVCGRLMFTRFTTPFGQFRSEPLWCYVSVCSYVCMVITYSKGKDQPGKVANPARGQLNRENIFFAVTVHA